MSQIHGAHQPIEQHVRRPMNPPGVPAAGRAALSQIRVWAREVEDYGWPHFDEFALRLAGAKQLVQADLLHARESRPCREEADSAARMAPSQDIISEQTEFLSDYDQLVAQLKGSHVCFVSWQAACRAVDAMAARFEQLFSVTGTGSDVISR